MASALRPIAPNCGLYLHSHGHGNEVRFCRLFGQVWNSLPPEDRDALIDHWDQWDRDDEGHLSVSIALENLSMLRGMEAVGNCALIGHELKFYARVIDMMHDDLVTYVIAHELAHVLQVSRGQRLRPDPHPLGEAIAYLLSPIEREADAIALAWGFDGSKLNRWLHENVRWHDLPQDPY
jgi:hypothetical protein